MIMARREFVDNCADCAEGYRFYCELCDLRPQWKTVYEAFCDVCGDDIDEDDISGCEGTDGICRCRRCRRLEEQMYVG